MKEFNQIAKTYDSLFEDDKSKLERATIANYLEPHITVNTTILDIGCGTGVLLDLFPFIRPKNYIAVDSSIHMINKLLEKHPLYEESVICAKYEQTSLKKQDIRISLFGSINYLDPNKVLFMSPSNYFFMFYKEGYKPKYSIPIKHNVYTLSKLKIFFKTVESFNNYYICTNLF